MNNPNIWISLTTPSKTLHKQLDDPLPSNPMTTFPINTIQITNTQLRAGATHTLTFTTPIQSILINQPFILQFWYTLQPAVFKPTCSLLRIDDPTKFDWLSSCQFQGYTNLLLTPKLTDANLTTTY